MFLLPASCPIPFKQLQPSKGTWVSTQRATGNGFLRKPPSRPRVPGPSLAPARHHTPEPLGWRNPLLSLLPESAWMGAAGTLRGVGFVSKSSGHLLSVYCLPGTGLGITNLCFPYPEVCEKGSLLASFVDKETDSEFSLGSVYLLTPILSLPCQTDSVQGTQAGGPAGSQQEE